MRGTNSTSTTRTELWCQAKEGFAWLIIEKIELEGSMGGVLKRERYTATFAHSCRIYAQTAG